MSMRLSKEFEVEEIVPGGPAACAGIRVGDTLVDFDGALLQVPLSKMIPPNATSVTVGLCRWDEEQSSPAHLPRPSSAPPDGEVEPDCAWTTRLRTLIDATPLESSLSGLDSVLAQLVAAFPSVNRDHLLAVAHGQADDWSRQASMQHLGLPDDFLPFAVAILVYTLLTPGVCVHTLVSAAMDSPRRALRGEEAVEGPVSPELCACLPYIKFLDEALRRLPDSFVYHGPVQRGVRWVWPSAEEHAPERHFRPGATLHWHGFRAGSTKAQAMSSDRYCGSTPGPRTIFATTSACAYRIADFCYSGDSEGEVLFPPLTRWRVDDATKLIIDPRETLRLERSGHPDLVNLTQVGERTPSRAPRAEEAQEESPADPPAVWTGDWSRHSAGGRAT